MKSKNMKSGYSFVLSQEQIKRFKDLSPAMKLEWLEQANDFVNSFVGIKKRRVWEKFKKGEYKI